MRNKCDECGGKLVTREIEFKLYRESLGKFLLEVCLSCGEEVFDEETSDKIDMAVRESLLKSSAGQIGSKRFFPAWPRYSLSR